MLSLYLSGEFKPSQKVTIYKKNSMFGNIQKFEMRLIEFGTKKYAQYNSAPFVAGIIKRKRKAIKFTETHNPYMIIVDGWDNIEVPSMWNKEVVKNDLIIKTQKHESFSENYESDFDSIIDELISSKQIKVLADYRGIDSYGNL